MRLRLYIVICLVALIVGVILLRSQSIVEWWWPSFTANEVVDKVGRRVRYRHTDKFRGMKCPADGFCREIADGEQGAIIGLERVGESDYFLIVRWDEPADAENYLSYFGRYSGREALVE